MRRRGLLLDLGGTLLSPAEPVALTYARFGAPYGVRRGPDEIHAAFKAAFLRAGPGQIGDGRLFWSRVVAESTGCADPGLFEALYAHFLKAEAWTVAPGAPETLRALRAQGVRLAVVSNWDSRLEPTLEALGLRELVDAVLVSGQIGAQKPAAVLFLLACARLGLLPGEAVHLGDDLRADVQGARAAGCRALWWGQDLRRWSELTPERLDAAV